MQLPLISEYWNYVARQPPDHDMPSGAGAVEYMFEKLAVATALFSLMYLVVPAVSKTFFPAWYESLNERRKKDMPAYVVCLFHHIFLVPLAWYRMVEDFYRPPGEFDYAPIYGWIFPISVGYLLGDTIGYALPELFFYGKVEFILHHALTVWLIWVACFGEGRSLRYIPHLLICDSSNLFFNFAWLLRTTSWKNSALTTFLELCFALFFLITRVINLPAAFLAIYLLKLTKDLGWAMYAMPPICMMQWFWFAKIAAGLGERLRAKKKAGGKEQ